MKSFRIFVLFLAVISMSCKDNKANQNKVTSTNTVKHYICSNNCENSGGAAAGNCPECKNPYTHNQAYHDKDFLKNGPLTVPDAPGTTPTTSKANQPSPAQNAAGVYHYTCKNSHQGGSGTATTCSVCGETLVHNTAYHN